MPIVRLVKGAELGTEHVARWSQLQQASAEYSSPYFRPEFTRAVAAVRDDVEVAILEHDAAPVGYFPFQRGNWDIARPVGGRLSDFQAVIADPGASWDARELIAGCGLAAWEFDHLIAAQSQFDGFHDASEPSPYMDLTQGFDAYRAERKAAGSSELEQTIRKARKLQREVGPLRFEQHTGDRRALTTLLDWKAQQYQRSGLTNVFGVDWTVQLLEAILARREEAFSGMLSALYAGDRLVAVHYGMRAHGVLHCWFPAYDAEYAKHSPGLVLLVELAKACGPLGIHRIDLGKGTERYKLSFASGSTYVAEGIVDCRSLPGMLRRGWRRTKQWVKTSPLREPARKSARWVKQLVGTHEFL